MDKNSERNVSMNKIFWFLGLCLSTVGVTGALQAGQNPSKQAPSKQAEDSEWSSSEEDFSDSSSSEEDVPDEPVDPSEGAAAAPARLSVRDRVRMFEQGPATSEEKPMRSAAELSRDQVRMFEQGSATSERKPIRSASELSPDQINVIARGFQEGILAGADLINQRRALQKQLQAKRAAFQAEDAVKQAEMASVQGGWGFASALDSIWGGKKAAFQKWRAREMALIESLEQQISDIERDIETLQRKTRQRGG